MNEIGRSSVTYTHKHNTLIVQIHPIDHACCPTKIRQGLLEPWWQKFGDVRLKTGCYGGICHFSDMLFLCVALSRRPEVIQWKGHPAVDKTGHYKLKRVHIWGIFEPLCFAFLAIHLSIFTHGTQKCKMKLKNTERLRKWKGIPQISHMKFSLLVSRLDEQMYNNFCRSGGANMDLNIKFGSFCFTLFYETFIPLEKKKKSHHDTSTFYEFLFIYLFDF